MTSQEESPGAPQRRGSFVWVYVGLVLAAGLVYSNTLSFGAAWDDSRFVFNSGATEGVAGIPEMFRTQMVRDMPAGRGAYRPLTASSYALDWSLGGGEARFFHWTNVLLHMLVTALVLVLTLRLRAPPLAAASGALVFAVHPVHVEAVANIAGRAELLVGLFMLGAVVLYLGRRTVGREVGILALFGAALLSKEHGVTLPVLLVAVEWLRPHDDSPALPRLLARWRLWLGMGVVGAGYMLARRAVLGTFTTSDIAPFIGELSPGRRVTSAVANWVEYARLHVVPIDLSVDYGPAVVMPSGPGDVRFWLGLGVGALVLVGAIAAYRRHRLATLGAAWFAIVMLPSSNLLVPIAQWLAERFFYVPSVGFSLAVAALVAGLPGRINARERRIAAAAFVLAVLFFVGRSWSRNQRWEDSDTVIATLITEHPEAFRAQWYLGRIYFEQNRLTEAFAALDRATELQPNAIELPLERAEWLIRLDRADEAEALLRGLPAGFHADREGWLVRSLLAQGNEEAADSAIGAALIAFPRNPRLALLADSIASSR